MRTSSSRPRIAAVVLTHNRCHLLDECLDALSHQVRLLDEIVVVDNASTDGTAEMLKQKYDGKISYTRLAENLGSAGGFHEGIRVAHEKGYDWIWVMDDDVKPQADALKALVESPGFGDPSVGLLASLVLETRPPNHSPHYEHFNRVMASYPDGLGWAPIGTGQQRRFSRTLGFCAAISKESLQLPLIPVDGAGFLGILIRREAISAVDLPLKELFMFWDDLEFTYRISRRFKMFVVPASKILHWHGWNTRSPRKFLGFAKEGASVPIAQIWKVYYFVRNEIYVRTKYSKSWLAPLVPVMVLTKSLGATILFYDHPLGRCQVLFRAGVDGILGRIGKRMIPGKKGSA
jgi:rhamnopyranosyl-N-acetylglucosaminyl-diphospho-decaprenol beta-1,3/1,4-galactofuranosyltransferase